MLRHRRLSLLLAVLMVATAFLGGCGPKASKTTQININMTGTGGDPSTIDPAVHWSMAGAEVDLLLFSGLTDINEKTNEVIPKLATSWDISEDGLTWTFHLRKDVNWIQYDPAKKVFNKKRPVTAHDVEYGIKRTLLPETAAEAGYCLYSIKNAEAYNTGEITDPEQVGVKALDDYTLQVTLHDPAAYFGEIAAMWIAYPMPKEVIDQYGDKWTDPGNIWTCGPYVISDWKRDTSMTMIKDPNWYDAKTVSIDQINWQLISDASTAFAMYEKGDLDTCDVPPEDVARVAADPVLGKELTTVFQLNTYNIWFDNGKPPFENKLVRQAFSYAVDRQKLVDEVLKGGEKPATAFAPEGVYGTPVDDPNFKAITFDAAKAKQLLADAGFPDGQGLPEIVYMYPTNDPVGQKVAEFLQKQWKENLGVEVKLFSQESGTFWQTVAEDPPAMWRSDWIADYPDENNFLLENFHSTRGINRIRWKNDEFDKLVEEAAVSTDPAKRKELYFKAEEILVYDEAGIAPLFYRTRNICTKPYLTRTFDSLGFDYIHLWKMQPH